MLERAHVEPLDSATYRLTWQVFRTPVTRRAMLVRARPTEARKPRPLKRTAMTTAWRPMLQSSRACRGSLSDRLSVAHRGRPGAAGDADGVALCCLRGSSPVGSYRRSRRRPLPVRANRTRRMANVLSTDQRFTPTRPAFAARFTGTSAAAASSASSALTNTPTDTI